MCQWPYCIVCSECPSGRNDMSNKTILFTPKKVMATAINFITCTKPFRNSKSDSVTGARQICWHFHTFSKPTVTTRLTALNSDDHLVHVGFRKVMPTMSSALSACLTLLFTLTALLSAWTFPMALSDICLYLLSLHAARLSKAATKVSVWLERRICLCNICGNSSCSSSVLSSGFVPLPISTVAVPEHLSPRQHPLQCWKQSTSSIALALELPLPVQNESSNDTVFAMFDALSVIHAVTLEIIGNSSMTIRLSCYFVNMPKRETRSSLSVSM